MKTHARAFFILLMRHFKRFGWVWLAVLLALSLLTQRWHPAINRTESLPFSLFVVDHAEFEPKLHDFVAFEPKRSVVGGYKLTFIKQIACLPGQTLSVQNQDIFCDGAFVARAKTHSLKGEPLEAIASGRIPEDKYFVRGFHRDSFDSRYEKFGLVDACRFKGKAVPIF